MRNRSSTSSSEPVRRRWIALTVALVLVLGGEALFLASGDRLMGYEESILHWKMNRLGADSPDADVLLLGASRVVHGLVPHEMEAVWGGDLSCVNLAINGCPVETLVIILDEYLEHHPPPRAVLASVVPLFLGHRKPLAGGFEVRSLYRPADVARLGPGVGFDPWLNWIEGRVPSRARLAFVRHGLQYGSFRFPALGQKEGLIHCTPAAIRACLDREAGYAPFVAGSLAGRKRVESAYWDIKWSLEPRRVDQLHRLADLCADRGIPLFLFATPQPLSLFNRGSSRGYNRQVSRFWDHWLSGRPDVHWLGPRLRAGANNRFADWWCHPTETAARDFSRRLAGELAEAWSANDIRR